MAAQRLRNQHITRATARRPEDVVVHLGAVQAQEYPAARWGLALRMRDGTCDADIERAVNEGRILRTHVMRPTWHFVTPGDIRWMLELTAPRVHKTMAHYGRRQGLDAATVSRACSIFERALGDHQYLTRGELGEALSRADISAKGIRLALLTMYAELDGVMCSGPFRGRHLTYALLAERAPKSRALSRDEALAELTRRYFSSHGPATIRDFVWWSGLTTRDARRGLDMNRTRHEVREGLTYSTVGRAARDGVRDPRVHLLPIYDEYLVAYRDREAVPHGPSTFRTRARQPVTFQHALVVGGQVAGTWRVHNHSDGVKLDVAVLRRLSAAERQGLADAVTRYGRFLSVPSSFTVR